MLAQLSVVARVLASLLILAIVVIVYRRPRWAGLYYDAACWRLAVCRWRHWVREKIQGEAVLMLAAFLIALATTEGLWHWKVAAGIGSAIGVLALAGTLMLLWYAATAPAVVYQRQNRKLTALRARLSDARRNPEAEHHAALIKSWRMMISAAHQAAAQQDATSVSTINILGQLPDFHTLRPFISQDVIQSLGAERAFENMGGLTLAFTGTTPLLRKVSDEIDRIEAEWGLRVEQKPSVRPKNQAISDTLRAYHERGIALLGKKIRNDAERASWKAEWKKFLDDLWKEMEALKCSDSEIHKIKSVRMPPQLPFPGTHPNAIGLKSHLNEQLNRIETLADLHDTTKPVS